MSQWTRVLRETGQIVEETGIVGNLNLIAHLGRRELITMVLPVELTSVVLHLDGERKGQVESIEDFTRRGGLGGTEEAVNISDSPAWRRIQIGLCIASQGKSSGP